MLRNRIRMVPGIVRGEVFGTLLRGDRGGWTWLVCVLDFTSSAEARLCMANVGFSDSRLEIATVAGEPCFKGLRGICWASHCHCHPARQPSSSSVAPSRRQIWIRELRGCCGEGIKDKPGRSKDTSASSFPGLGLRRAERLSLPCQLGTHTTTRAWRFPGVGELGEGVGLSLLRTALEPGLKAGDCTFGMGIDVRTTERGHAGNSRIGCLRRSWRPSVAAYELPAPCLHPLGRKGVVG